MKYKYPKVSNTVTYRRVDSDRIEVVDFATGNSFEVGIDVARYMKKLDGNIHPYGISTELTREDINCLLGILRKYEFSRTSDTVKLDGGAILKTLWVPKWTPLLKGLARLCNLLLLILWLPVLVIGAWLFYNNFDAIGVDGAFLGYIAGLILGLALHELGHAFAGIAYNARVFELGVMVSNYVMPGAYALICDEKVKPRFQKAQILAAGVETNFLIAGISLILGSVFLSCGGFFLFCAICNLLLAVGNLSFMKGTDGMAIITILLDIDGSIEDLMKSVTSYKQLIRLKQRGINGYGVIALGYVFCVIRFFMPLLIIWNIVEIIWSLL